MNRVMLAGKDWKTRALLRAQLIEEGLDVEAHDSVAAALESLEATPALPGLLLVDLAESDDPSSDAEQLAGWAAQVPIWVIASRSLIAAESLKGHGFEVILFRPVDVGKLVTQIQQRLDR